MKRKRHCRSWMVGDLFAGLPGLIGDIIGGLFDNDWWS